MSRGDYSQTQLTSNRNWVKIREVALARLDPMATGQRSRREFSRQNLRGKFTAAFEKSRERNEIA